MATTELSLTKPYETVNVSIDYNNLPTFIDSGGGGLTGYDWKYYYFDAGANCEAQRFIFDVHFTGSVGDRLYFRKLGYSSSNDISTVINAIKSNSSPYLSSESYFSNGTRVFDGYWPTSAFRYYWVLFRESAPLTNVTVDLTYTKCAGTYRGAVIGTIDYLDGQLSYGLFYPLNYDHNSNVKHPIMINLPGQIIVDAASSIYQTTASIFRINETWDSKYNCFGISFHWADTGANGRGDTNQIAPTTLIPTYNKLLGDYNTAKQGAREGTWVVSGIYKAIQYLINRFNIDENRIYLAGYSWGGIVAYEFAKQFPSVLAGMIVADAGFFPEYWTTDPYNDQFTSPAEVSGQSIYPYFVKEIKRIKHIPTMFSALRHGYAEIQMLRIHDEIIRQGGESHYVFNDHNSAVLKEWKLNNTDTLFVGDGKYLTITIGGVSFDVTFLNGINYSLTSIVSLINTGSSSAGLGSVAVQGSSSNCTYIPSDPIKGNPAKYGLMIRHPSYTTNYTSSISITTDQTASYYSVLGNDKWYIKNSQDYTEYGVSEAVDFYPFTTNVRWVNSLRSDHDYGMSDIIREQYFDWLFSKNKQNNTPLMYSRFPVVDETYKGGKYRKYLGPGLDIQLTNSDKIKYSGYDDSTVKVGNTDYTVSVSGGNLVWDKGGESEHTFSTVGERVLMYNDSGLFRITYQGEGSYLFDIDMPTTYYVDKNGIGGTPSDNNPGTITSPWETLKHAFSTVGAGDVVYVRAGTYYEALNCESDFGTAQNPIVFAAFQDEEVIINPGLMFDDWEPYDSYGNIWYKTFPADNESVEHISFAGTWGVTEVGAIKRAEIENDPNSGLGISQYAEYTESGLTVIGNGLQDFINFVEGESFSYDMNSSHYDFCFVDAPNRTVYIKLANGDPNTDVYMVDNNRRFAINRPYIEINGFTIQYSFEGFKAQGAVDDSDPSIIPNNLNIINNKIQYAYGQGILITGYDTNNILIENNEINFCGKPFKFYRTIENQQSVIKMGRNNLDHTVYFAGGSNGIIRNNLLGSSCGQSLHPWASAEPYYHTRPDNLYIYNNYVQGGFVCTGTNMKVYNNVFVESALPQYVGTYLFVIYPTDGLEVYYNTIVGEQGVYIGIGHLGGEINENIIFKNNIVKTILSTFVVQEDGVDLSTCLFNNNLYYCGESYPNGRYYKCIIENGSENTYDVGTTLSEWQSYLVGKSTLESDNNSITGDPLLDSYNRIKYNSPAKNQATQIISGVNGATVTITTDMYENIR